MKNELKTKKGLNIMYIMRRPNVEKGSFLRIVDYT